MLARLHDRTHEDDTLHPVALERLDGTGHGEVGLAGTGRADTEIDIVRQNPAHVLALMLIAWTHHALGRAQVGFGIVGFITARQGQLLQRLVHPRQRQGFVARGRLVQRLEQVLGTTAAGGLAGNAERIAPVGDLDSQVFLDLAQMLILAPAQAGQPLVIGGGETEFDGFDLGVQGNR
jgi:hypothetical protein